MQDIYFKKLQWTNKKFMMITGILVTTQSAHFNVDTFIYFSYT